jgi:hypothetical protein
MKYYLLLIILVLTTLYSCSEEEPIPSTTIDSFYVSILSPNDKESISTTQRFSGTIYSDSLPESYRNLKVIWRSDRDGILFEHNLDSTQQSNFETKNLSNNIHIISLELQNEIGSIIKDEITIYNVINLKLLEENETFSTISWNTVDNQSFQSFELYRSSNRNNLYEDQPIYSSSNKLDTLYTDSSALINQRYYYQVSVKFDDGEIISSNILQVRHGQFIDVSFPILKMSSDYSRSMMYGIVAPKNLSQELDDGYGLIALDIKNLEIKYRILKNERFVDIAISPDGDYLYAATTNRIYKIYLVDFSILSSFSGTKSIRGIEIGSNNRLYYHIDAGRYCSCSSEFRIIDLENETELPYLSESPAYQNYYRGEFTINPTNNDIYHGNTLSSPTITRFSTVNDIFSNRLSKGGWGFLTSQIYYRNEHVFWHHLLLDSDLNILGSFKKNGNEITIIDVSELGNLALGNGSIYTTVNQSIIKNIPAYFELGKFISDEQLILVKKNVDDTQATIIKYPF